MGSAGEMSPVFVLLPAFTFVVLFTVALGSGTPETGTSRGLKASFLVGTALWGAVLIAITEALSLFHAINRFGLSVMWGAVLASWLGWGLKSGRWQRGWGRFWDGANGGRRTDYLLLGGFCTLAGLLLVVALVAPPNTVDALQYHMPRVAHWAQNQSLQHYAAANFGQNPKPIWAEVAILNLRVLWGTDRLVGLVEWFALVACSIGAAAIADSFGAGRTGQWLAAAFAFSLPSGILQSPTALNDYASAYWVVVVAYFVILSSKRELANLELGSLAVATGLGMLTKGTFFPYAAPLLAWCILAQLRRGGASRAIRTGLVIVAVATALNLGFWSRNLATYGDLYGGSTSIIGLTATSSDATPGLAERLRGAARASPGSSSRSAMVSHEASTDSPRFPDGTALPGLKILTIVLQGLGSQVGKLLRMLAINFVTPFSWVNRRLFDAFQAVPGVFHAGFIQGVEAAQWNNEMTAGNPLHLLLGFAALVIVGASAARRRITLPCQLSAAALFGFALLSLVHYSDWIFSIRYQIAFLLLLAPVFGTAFSRLKGGLAALSAGALILYAAPYVLFSNMRPIIGHPPWPTRIGSIFTTDQEDILFAQSPFLRDEYELFVQQVQMAGCQKVGLSLAEGDLEYVVWRLFRAPESGTELQHVTASGELKRYLDLNFTPCAILCTQCQGMQGFHGLPLWKDAGHIQLYLGGG